MPTLVPSVAEYVKKVESLGGQVLIEGSTAR
jgi:hypothetical protein